MITILSAMENHYKSLFLLGGRRKSLQKAESNVRSTFPNLQIVGRYVGYYSKEMEPNIVQAIFKASPSLVIVSDGIKEKKLWAYNRRNNFSSSIFLYYRDAIGICSERINRISEKKFNKGLEIWGEIFRNPLKIFLVFPYLYYVFLLIWTRLFKKKWYFLLRRVFCWAENFIGNSRALFTNEIYCWKKDFFLTKKFYQ